MATSTKPRRTRTGNPQDDRAAADAAIAAENAKITPPKAEPCPHDLDPATCAECNGSAEAERKAEAEPTPEPEPSKPTAQLSIGRFPYWMHRPSITAPDGTVHTCQHRDGHEKIKAAMTCARSLGSEAGLTVPAADPSWPEGGPGEPVT